MKKHLTSQNVMIASLMLLSLSSCNLPQRASPTSEIARIVSSTQTALSVSQYLTATNLPLAIPPTSTLPPAGQTPLPTQSAAPSQLTSGPPPTNGIPPTAQPGCKNAAKFEGETIPDGSIYFPGQDFMKTWTLRNVGTCTWNSEYALVFVRGEQMGGTSPSPIGQTVPPGGTIQIYLPQKAPNETGERQGYWMLRSPAGQDFGLGANAEVAFWVKIVVVPTTSGTGEAPFGGPQNLGAPVRVIDFESGSSPWYLGTDDGIDYDIEDGELLITTDEPTGDRWRVAQPGWVDDFYMQGTFKTGEVCAGKDGYGLLVRAPEKPNGVIDSGYAFSFSCDGKYRVYRLDNGNFSGIQNWAASSAIHAGPKQTNIMGVYASGLNFQLYANGILIYQFSDSGYSDGLFGLLIRSESSQPFQIAVDEVAIWDLK
jgi:hypothetical protein